MSELTLEHVGRTFDGPVTVEALKDATLRIRPGEYIAIEGPSGSGKSTLLNQIALLDTPTSGHYDIDGEDVSSLGDVQRARLRSRTFAFIFQSFHLLEGRSVIENVALGSLYRGLRRAQRIELAQEALEFVGLSHKAGQRAALLSGGERQRVAIARAIVSRAPVIVADEPTGNLDQASGELIMATLERLNAEGATLIIVTHDPRLAARAKRRIQVLDGQVSEAAPVPRGVLEQGPISRLETEGIEHDADMPGRDSRLRVIDAVRDAWQGLRARCGRSAVLVISVALGVGLALTTAGLAATAQAQVSELFDAQRNQRVGLALGSLEEQSPEVLLAPGYERLNSLAGVDATFLFANHSTAVIKTGIDTDPGGSEHDVVGVVEGRLPPEIVRVASPSGVFEQGLSLEGGEVVIGAQLAAELQLGPLAASPVIWVDGLPRRVVGILEDAGLQVNLLNSVLMPEENAVGIAAPNWAAGELKVVSGAAQQVARQAPAAWNPTQPESVTVDAPPDPDTLRDDIESNLATMLLTLTGVALLAAVLSLTNAMTGAVFQRIGEFGLRRAIGARRIHIVVLVIVESLTVGLLGGLVGVYGAVVSILGVTLARHWQPVLDPVLIPLGLAGGMLVGLIGGLVATWKASRIEPANALRAAG